MSDNETILKVLEDSSKFYGDCVLCNKKTRNRGLFFPKDSVAFGAPEGKTRVIVYPICYKHVDTEEKASQVVQVVEGYIFSHIEEFTNLTSQYKRQL